MATSSNPKKLTIYLDCVSLYSWFGFTNIRRYRPVLNGHNVEVEILPFVLGAARNEADNPFGPAPQVKAIYAGRDSATVGRLLGLKVVPPKQFPVPSMTAIRVLQYVKDNMPAAKFEAAFEALVSGYWGKSIIISTPEGITEALEGVFSAGDIADLLKKAVTPENKAKVIEVTKSAGPGAFGAPWIKAVNGEGKMQTFFGNDRWDHVFEYLGVPYIPVSVVPAEKAAAKL